MSEVSTLPYGVNTGRWSTDLDENGNRFPMTNFDTPITTRPLDGDSAGELTIEAQECTGVDYTEIAQILSARAETTIDELNIYRQEVTKAREILCETHPAFSEVVEDWVDAEIEVKGYKNSLDEQHRVRRLLFDELAEEYQSEIDNGNTSAQAEWDVMRDIMQASIVELELDMKMKDMTRTA